MAQTAPTTVYAFVSYAHSDGKIAETIDAQLRSLARKGRGREALDCFLDTRSIKPGQRWEPIITAHLHTADWLIVVFTGDQSEYCGFEIGMFSQINDLLGSSPIPEKRLLCLHDVDMVKLPTVLKPYQAERVIPLSEALNEKSVTAGEENDFWWESPVGRFLRAFCQYKALYLPDPDNPTEFKEDVIEAAKAITEAFDQVRSTDEKEETPTQFGIQLKIKGSGSNKLTQIPDDAVATGTSITFAIFGLYLPLSATRAPQITWGELRAKLLKPERTDVPWMEKIEQDILRAAEALEVSGDEVTFLGRDGRIYRPILVRHKLYVDGTRKFYILFVETINRRFIGRRETSLLLISLVLASRWRFTYFENWEHTLTKKFGDGLSIQEFSDNCKQLRYFIEWMEHESLEFGVDDPKSLVEAFGFEKRARIERFYSDWESEKGKLYATLPSLNQQIEPEKREEIKRGVLEFLGLARTQNAEFLQLSIESYSAEILGELRKETLP